MPTTSKHPRLQSYLNDARPINVAGPDQSKYEFHGTWIIRPSDNCMSGEPGSDAGTAWSVAVTAKGRFAVHVAHCNDRWEPRLDDYDTLDEVLEILPEDVGVELTARITGVRRLDI